MALEEVNVEASVEMVEEDGSPIVIPKVEERWTEEPAHNLTVGFKHLINTHTICISML